MNVIGIDTVQMDLDRLWERTLENAVQIYSGKSKAVCSKLFLGGSKKSGSDSLQLFGIILCSYLSWADHFNYTAKKPGKHFISYCVFLKREIRGC